MQIIKNNFVRRYDGNPILSARDFPTYAIAWVFNAGIVKHNNRYIMLCRVEDTAFNRYLWIADSDDGFKFKPRSHPVEVPKEDSEYQEYSGTAYFDPRITKIDDTFYIVYAAGSSHSCRLGLFKTVDFEEVKWAGYISETDNRNGVLFPEKIRGKYVRLDRPNLVNDRGDIWISYSPDLIYWGQSKYVLRAREVAWGGAKIGPGAVPIKTSEGWLTIFHGVRIQCRSHYVYQLGVMLLDLEDPSKVVAQAKRAILIPQMDYELAGQTPSVVFTCGAVVEESGEVKIYYGGADSVMCVALTTIDALVVACKEK